jgi:DNA-binding MarR family transcriptional regulator
MPLRLVPPIHRATHRIGLYLAGLKDEALSQGEAHILALLATSGPSTIAELHRGLAHKRSTLTSILDRLAARGFVTRAVGSADRRTFCRHANREGRRVAARVPSPHGSRACCRARVSSDDIRGFMKVLAAVEDEAHSADGTPAEVRDSSLASSPVSISQPEARTQSRARR